MSIDRRASGQTRRRRVLYQSTLDTFPETAAERRSAERLREARRPAANYGSHVNRRLRGRWFSLVPVGRTAMTACSALILGSAILLSLAHWASVTWAPLAYNAELARPLRMDRADSFGSWTRTLFLAASSATALLVYQLRRYKVDDYTGSYRIWRTVIILIGLMSLDSIVNLVPWSGAMIDAVLGKRVALSGADWVRIVLTVGGGALALRLVAEVRRSKISLSMMVIAIACFAIAPMGHWKLIDTTQMPSWLMSTTAPLLASAALWISIGGYLRMLFREVRGLDLQRAVDVVETPVAKSNAKAATPGEQKRRWLSLRRSASVGDSTEKTSEKPTKARNTTPKTTPPSEDAASNKPEPAEKAKRAWFGFGKPKNATQSSTKSDTATVAANAKVNDASKPVATAVQSVEKAAVAPKPAVTAAIKKPDQDVAVAPKKSWFSFGRKEKVKPIETKSPDSAKTTSPSSPIVASKTSVAAKPTEKSPAAGNTNPSTEKPARKGLGSWLRRDSAAKPAAAESTVSAGNAAKPPNKAANADSDDDEDDEINDDSVDWGSMNKSERRRMRKEMKRAGRAA